MTFAALDIRPRRRRRANVRPAPGGGTLGIAYAGRCFCETGSRFRVFGAARGGVFGNDGSTRANLGIMNEGLRPDGRPDHLLQRRHGRQLKQFFVSAAAGHILEENEVYQLNNIFRDPRSPRTSTPW